MKLLGFTEDFTVCECCGKKNLKGTFAFKNNLGEIYRWGSSCIKKAYQMDQKEFTAKLKADEKEIRDEAKAEFYATEIGQFYKGYLGSAAHEADLKSGGFALVAEKLKPSKVLKEEIRLKYGFRFFTP